MGKAIAGAALIAGGIALDVATGGAASFLTTQMILSGVAMEAGAIAHALGAKSGIGITTRQAAAYRQLIYGEYRVGAVNVYRSTTGSAHDQFNFVDVLAGHQIDSIVGMYLDGRPVYWQGSGWGYVVRNGVGFGGVGDSGSHSGPGGQQYNFGGTGHSGIFALAHFGDQTETYAGPNYPPGTPSVIADLTANDPSWAASGGEAPTLMGCAYLYFKCEYNPDQFPSEPERRYTVRGKNNIFDPRTGTYGWTNNWALIVADMLTDTTFGLGDVGKVDQTQLIAAANICDESVALANGNTEKRYTLNKAYDTSVSPGDMLDDAMKAAAGRLSYVGGKWFIYPRSWAGVSYSFPLSVLTGPVQWKPRRSLKDRCNRVRGTYMAPNVPYNDAGNLYDSNGWFNGTTLDNFPYCWHPTSYPQYAQDVLHGYAEDVFLEEDSGSLGAYDGAATYDAGDVVTESGVLYKSLIDANTGNQPSTHSWAGAGAAAAYGAGTTYALGDGAVSGGQLYVSLQAANVGHTPASSPTYWAAVVWVRYEALLPLELSHDNVISVGQAQRLAKIALLTNRQEGRGTLPLSLACYGVQPLDVIEIPDDLVVGGKLLEVTATRFYTEADPNDSKAQRVRFEVDVQETDSSIDDWSTAEELTVYDVPANPTIAPWGLSALTSLVVTSSSATAVLGADGVNLPRLLAAWDTTSEDSRATAIRVQHRVHGTSPWTDDGTVAIGMGKKYISGVIVGTVYDVQIRAEGNGSVSPWTEVDSTTAAAPNSSSNSYSIASQFPLTQPTSTSIAVAAFAATFDGGFTLNYAARTLTIAAPSVPTWYYVSIADPNLAGESGSPTLTATASTANTLVGTVKNIFAGAILALPAGSATRMIAGGWPNPYSSQVGV
jgi:hypothetical protein